MGRFGLGPASGSNMRVSISGPVSSFYFKSNCVSGFGLFLVVFLVFPGRYFLQSEAGERQSSGLVSGSTVMRPNLGSASGSSCTTSGSNSGSVSDWFWFPRELVEERVRSRADFGFNFGWKLLVRLRVRLRVRLPGWLCHLESSSSTSANFVNI
jgi:hypothetical protein